MTTAPTPSDAERLAKKLETGCWLVGDHGNPITQAAAELRRLQAENERLRGDYALRGAQIQRMAALIDELEARKPLQLSDEQIDAIADGMPGGLGGFMKTWGWRQFARKILDLRAPSTSEPQFDCMAPGQEELAIQFCAEIAGPRGQPGWNPDPVRLLEMAEALYKAEADAHGITGGSS